jgi:hypothetical protein
LSFAGDSSRSELRILRFLLDPPPAYTSAAEFRNAAHFLASDVIELKYSDIGLAAVDAIVMRQVFSQENDIPFLVILLIRLSSKVVFPYISPIMRLTVLTLTSLAIG